MGRDVPSLFFIYGNTKVLSDWDCFIAVFTVVLHFLMIRKRNNDKKRKILHIKREKLSFNC